MPKNKPSILADLDTDDFAPVQVKEPKKREKGMACVYFGPERLKKLTARANNEHEGNLSGLVCALIDSGLSLPPDKAKRLAALASLRGISPAKLLEAIVDDAIRV